MSSIIPSVFPADSSETIRADLDRAILALADALDFIGIDDTGHGHRVALMSAMCARSLGWDAGAVAWSARMGLLHDCGVSSTREHRHLVTEIAWEGEQAHCQRGADFLRMVPPLARMAPVIQAHHTPWARVKDGPLSERQKLDANLIYLTDRADALHATGVRDGKPLLDVLSRYRDSHFAPVLLDVFSQESRCEAFWFIQEDPSLRDYLRDILAADPVAALEMDHIRALARMFGHVVDAKSPFTERHSRGVALVALRLGRHFGLPGPVLDRLEIAALLHDLGKLRIPDELLEKPGPLAADERRTMARHAFDTHEVLRRVFGEGDIAQWAAFHHEYVSGQGYPFHTAGDCLPVEARIIAVADVFQALAQCRPYRAPLSVAEIIAILDGMVFGGKLDAQVVAAVKLDAQTYWQDAVAAEVDAPPLLGP